MLGLQGLAVTAILLCVGQQGNGASTSKPVVEITSHNATTTTKKPDLWCHRCFKSVHKEACMNVELAYQGRQIEAQHCKDDEPFCMVEKFRTDGNMTTFTRSCAKTCAPGCTTAGAVYRLEYCYDCCTENYCNTGNHATSIHSRHAPGLLMLYNALLQICAAAAVWCMWTGNR